MKTYINKEMKTPIPYQAIQFTGERYNVSEIIDIVGSNRIPRLEKEGDLYTAIAIRNSYGLKWFYIGDYIIREISGEDYIGMSEKDFEKIFTEV